MDAVVVAALVSSAHVPPIGAPATVVTDALASIAHGSVAAVPVLIVLLWSA
jgi:hypothetical protein